MARMTRQVPVKAVLFLGLTLLLTACPGEGETDDPCSCPNLEAVAPTIDWLGNGDAAASVQRDLERRPYLYKVMLRYEVADAFGASQETIRRLIDAGFPATNLRFDPPTNGEFQDDEWRVEVSPSTSQDSPLVLVAIAITDDDRAEEILQPFAASLGTLP